MHVDSKWTFAGASLSAKGLKMLLSHCVSQSNSQEWITLRPHDTPGGISDGQNSPTASTNMAA
jgi:hypothetical protein